MSSTTQSNAEFDNDLAYLYELLDELEKLVGESK